VETFSPPYYYILTNVLQWGHVQSDVETCYSGLHPNTSISLQWGHVQSDVETRCMWVRRTRPMCFNGATSNQTWKRSYFVVFWVAALVLQWGHVQSDVET